MKKVLLTFLFGIASSSFWAATTPTDYFSVSETKLTPGGDAAYVDVTLHGSKIYTAFQLDMELPVGLSVATNANGALRVSQLYDICPATVDEDTGTSTYSHILSKGYGVIGKRTLRIICYSTSSEAFTAQEGRVFRVYLKSDIYAKPGKADIKITNTVITPVDLSDVYPDDYSVSTVTVDTPASMSISVTSANKWGTVLVPFAATVPDGLRVFSPSGFTGDDDKYLALNEAKEFIPYKPYMVYADAGFSGTVSGNLEESYYPSSTMVGSNDYLRSCLEPTDISEGYIMQNQGSDDGAMFYTIFNKTFTIPAGKCWLIRPASGGFSEAKSIGFRIMNDENISTGIGKYTTAGNADAVYSIDGKIVTNPVVGNIYVIGGRKVLKVK